VGVRLSEVPTPALCVDLDVFERNLDRMHAFFADRPCEVRPHLKAHKTPAIARRQLEAGGVGFCCATLAEAEVFAGHGFDDLLIANEITDRAKLGRLRDLAERVTLSVAVDSSDAVQILAGTGLRVLIDVNVGMPRCGVPPEGAVALARAAADAGLAVNGVMGYEGHATIVDDRAERAKIARTSMEILLGVAADLRTAGFTIDVVSGGSTLTYDTTGTMDGITEIQAGSYALMDTAFAPSSDFDEAMRCVTTVLSVGGGIAVLDAGLKANAVDHGNPALPDGFPGQVLFLSDEHTTIATHDGFSLRPGDRTYLRPSHVDPTVNLYDVLYAVRGDEVAEEWEVAARGYRRDGP
jgi:D-threonine aldolase